MLSDDWDHQRCGHFTNGSLFPRQWHEFHLGRVALLHDCIALQPRRPIDSRWTSSLNRCCIGLLFIDTDNDVAGDFSTYMTHLADNAILGCDDYLSDDKVAARKATFVKAWVDGMVARGELLSLGVVPWGTWFGRLNVRR